jgi:SAM-dependent methyltransferase
MRRVSNGGSEPGVKRYVLHFETLIRHTVRKFAAGLAEGAWVLDAGAGECQYAECFSRQRYLAVDLGVGSARWNYGSLDARADLETLPFADASFDAAICIVALEHVREPALVLREIARTLRPAAALLLVVPFFWEIHQAPHDYWRFTRHGISALLEQNGFGEIAVDPAGGYFRLLARTLANGIKFFMKGWLWTLFPFAVMLLAPAAMIAPVFDGLDARRDFTLGYICEAKRSS